MWGSTFADLAEKARKQAEELSTQLPSSNAVSDGLSSYGVSGLFNLDSIQNGRENDNNAQHEHEQEEQLSSEDDDNKEGIVAHDNTEVIDTTKAVEDVEENDLNDDSNHLDPVNVEDDESALKAEDEEISDSDKYEQEASVVERLNNDHHQHMPIEEEESKIENLESVSAEKDNVGDGDGWDDDDIPIDDDDDDENKVIEDEIPPVETNNSEIIKENKKEVVESTSSNELEECELKSVQNPVEDVSSGDNIWNSSTTTTTTTAPQTTSTIENNIEEIEKVETTEEEEEVIVEEHDDHEAEDNDNDAADEIEEHEEVNKEESGIDNDQSSPIVENKFIERNDTKNNDSTQDDQVPSPTPIETDLPATTTIPQQQKPPNQSQSNKRPIDATPPHMVQKFMQQIQRITEHHKTEMLELELKLKEKDDLLLQYQQEEQTKPLERKPSSDKFKELQKQEEYYKKLINEQKTKLDDERSTNTALKTSLTQLDEKYANFSTSVKNEMENQRIEYKDIITKLECELSTTQNTEKEVRDTLEILGIEMLEKEDLFKKQIMEYQQIIKTKNVQLEEATIKVVMFQSNLDSLLVKEKDCETSSVQDKIKIQNLEQELSKFQNELDNQMKHSQTLQENLQKTEAEKNKSNEQYESLKGRVKVVATELKERRQENRDLKSNNSNMSAELVMLKDEKEKLKTELDNSKCSSTDKEQRSEEYQQRIKELEEELEVVQTKYAEAGAVGNVALQQYKKKAQAALANANARAASANQTKEEMEVEFRSLKAAAEEAEAERKDAIRERIEGIDKVSSDFNKLDETYQSTATELQQTTQKFKEVCTEKDNLEQGLQDSINEQHRLYDEIQKLSTEVTKHKEIVDSYSAELDQEKSITRDLTHSLRNLKEQHERSAAAAFLAKQKENSGMSMEDSSSADHAAGIAADCTKHHMVRNEGMVNMLQEELDGANEAIMELKRELRDALTREKERGLVQHSNNDASSISPLSNNHEEMSLSEQYHHNENKQNHHETNNNTSSSSTPLFYAIEKQAELKIASAEINRLASLVSELETLKQAAWEEKEDMRKNMEESEARLRRHEKLGASSVVTRSVPNAATRASPYGSMHKPVGPSHPKPESSENLNLEYLKNITLRYIKASSVPERKALIPVLAAVLCLTEDETQNAIQAVDSSGLGNVGNALFESTKYFLS